MFRRVVAFGRIRRSVWTNLAGAVAPPGHHGHRELVGKAEINADENLRQRVLSWKGYKSGCCFASCNDSGLPPSFAPPNFSNL
jgi:hypothetical protein